MSTTVEASTMQIGETDNSSWDPTFTYDIRKTRLIQIDIDDSEIGRNYEVELGIVADARQALAMIGDAAHALAPVQTALRRSLRAKIADGQAAFAANWAAQRSSDEFPLRPERVLADVRKALPRDGFIVTDVGWNKNGVGQQFVLEVPETMIASGGMATMGFGHAAVLGVKMAEPARAAVAVIGDGRFSSHMLVIAMAIEADVPVVWVVMDNASYGVISGIGKRHLGTTYGCMFEANGEPYFIDYATVAEACGARSVKIESAEQLTPALQEALDSGRLTVLQMPVQLVPTPTTGHCDINAIFRKPVEA